MKKEKSEKKLSLSAFMLDEAESTFRMFRDDFQKVKTSMEDRTKKIEVLRAEQATDMQKRLKLEGALSACNHLVTMYKKAWAQERDTKRAKKSGIKKHGKNRS